MATLNKYTVKSIIETLVYAGEKLDRMLELDAKNCREIWHESAQRDLRRIRSELLEAALSDVVIEAPDVRGGGERAEMVAVEGIRT